jgi:PEP-CTERM motif
MNPIFKLLASAAFGTALLPASAANFDFYKLGNGAGDFLPTDGVACTGGDLCSSNVNGGVLNDNLTFTTGGITAVATGTYNNAVVAVVQDHQAGWTFASSAGLGVYHVTGDTSDDNVTTGEKLTITFDRVVNLSAIGLRAEGHNVNGWPTGSTFLFNGTSTLLPDNVGSIALNQTGQVFTFAFGGVQPDQFYLASMSVAAVPEPGTYALAAVGFVARRRRTAA